MNLPYPVLRCLLLATTLLLAADAIAADADAPDAETVLKQACDRVRAAQQFQYDFTATIDVSAPGMEQKQSQVYTVRVARPNRFFAELREGSGSTGVSDGKILTMYSAELGQHTQGEAPAKLNEFVQSMEAAMLLGNGLGPLALVLLADDPLQAIMEGVEGVELVGTEQVNGQSCYKLRFRQPQFPFEMWITTGDEPTIVRLAPDLSQQFEGQEAAGLKITMAIDFAKWNLATDFPADAFAFTPPATSQLVESLFPEAEPVGPHPLVGKKAEPFELQTLEAQPFTLGDLIGKKIVVLDFWATWCGPCVEALPQIVDVAKKYEDREVVLYAVNLQEDAPSITEFLKANALNVNVLLDTEGAVAQKYGVDGIPQTVIIGRDGRVQVVHVGLVPELKQQLAEELEALIAGKDLAAEALEAEDPTAKPDTDAETPAQSP